MSGFLGLLYAAAVHGQGFQPDEPDRDPLVLRLATSLATEAKKPDARLVPLDVVLNGAKMGSWILLESDGRLFAPVEAINEWRLKNGPEIEIVERRGLSWFALASIPGFAVKTDWGNQSVELSFSPDAFAATRLVQEREERPVLTPSVPALFANYDVSYTDTHSAARVQELGSLMEVGMTGSFGVLTTSLVGRNLTGSDTARPRSWNRLETTYTRDFASDNITLRLGDSSARNGFWGRPFFFGGIQIGRNFGLTQGFVTQPVPVITGTSTAPSTVEVYINDALRQTSNVPTGPFTIDNFPLVTGGGQARVVVRDVLGRETVLTQPFFSHSDLLEQDLTDWSVEAGAVRQNLGTASADYGEGFVSGLWRLGLSKSLTLEASAGWGRETRNVGMGASFALPGQVLAQSALAWSYRDGTGQGGQWLLGLERSGAFHSVALRAEGATQAYRWAGSADSPPPELQLSGSYSFSSEGAGVVGLAGAYVKTRGLGSLSTLSLNYSVRLGQRSSLAFSLTRVLGAAQGVAAGMSLMIPLQDQVNLAGSAFHRGGRTEGYVAASQGLTAETGSGWRVLAGTRGGEAFSEGGWSYQGSRGLVTADVSTFAGHRTLRLGAQGGLVAIDGRVLASRTVQDSFALVEVPGYPDVGVHFQGSKLTRTDRDGIALLPRLHSFTHNAIQLDPSELPINAELDTIEQVAVPAWRSAVKVTFPVRSGRAALARIVFDDDEPAPAGAPIEIAGDQREFFVARRGEAFITGLQATNELRLKWKGATCAITLELPEVVKDEIARVGPLTCKGVQR